MAARIPQEFLDQLLGRVDVIEIIDARVPLRKVGREYTACCPFHTEKTPSFTVSPVKQFYHCFGCGAHGNAIGFLMEYEHLGFLETVEELARRVGLTLPRGVNKEQDSHGNLITVMEQANDYFRQQLRQHPTRDKAIAYLRNRGVDGETVNTFRIGYAPPGWDNLLKALTKNGILTKDMVAAGLVTEQNHGNQHDRFRERIMFPIRNRRGHTIAFGGRVLGSATPKYLNSPETPLFHKGRELYGLYEARANQRHLRRLVVVEGYMDVIALAQHGIPYAVATLGTATTPKHLEQLFRMTSDVIFCFDGDHAGREAAWRALENALPLLQDGRQIGFLFLPEGQDPDSLVRSEGQQIFERRLTQPLPLSDYFFERLQSEVDINSIDGRARLAERSRPLLNKLPDSLYRDMMIQRLADLAEIDKIGIQRRLTISTPVASISQPDRDINPTRTPVRLAIALLLNRLDLAQRADDLECFRGIEVPGLPLLLELVELLRNHPQIKSAAQLLTRYQGTETGRILERLAEWQPALEDALIETEFFGVLKKLKKLYVEKQFFDKIARGELSLEKKELLRSFDKIP